MDEPRSGVFNLVRTSLKYKSIHVRDVLESNMERHCLITSQLCKLLTGTRGRRSFGKASSELLNI